MFIYYVDESGCLGTLPSATSPIQPVFQYFRIRDLAGDRLQRMQYRYQDPDKWWHGGITVSDALGHQRGGVLFGS
ncbi:MAG: hypothetical protein ABSH34_24975 [Verrucomicrobiota bacterium]|jgi:hypothetical protein